MTYIDINIVKELINKSQDFDNIAVWFQVNRVDEAKQQFLNKANRHQESLEDFFRELAEYRQDNLKMDKRIARHHVQNIHRLNKEAIQAAVEHDEALKMLYAELDFYQHKTLNNK